MFEASWTNQPWQVEDFVERILFFKKKNLV